MAARKHPKPPEGTIWRAVYDSGRWDYLQKRRERWGLAWCPDEPAPGVPWKRFRFRTPVPAPWTDCAAHGGTAGSRILRYAVWHGGGSAAICTTNGYTRGTVHEVLGTDAQLCRLGIEAPIRAGITKTWCLEQGLGWGTWDAEHGQRRVP